MRANPSPTNTAERNKHVSFIYQEHNMMIFEQDKISCKILQNIYYKTRFVHRRFFAQNIEVFTVGAYQKG